MPSLQSKQAAPHWKTIFFPILFIAAICTFGYSNSMGNAFMLDDHLLLTGEHGVANRTLASLFSQRQTDFYRPFGHIFLLCCQRLFGGNASSYHVANLFLFITIGFCFFHITYHLFHNLRLAYLTAALYCLHPINSMLINYITANIISTFVLFQQLSLLAFLHFRRTAKKRGVALSCLFYVAALLSHEMSLMFPAYIFCTVFFLDAGDKVFKKSLLLSLPYVFLAAAYLGFRMIFFSLHSTIQNAMAIMPEWQAFGYSIARLIGWYLSKLVIPKDILFVWTLMLPEDPKLFLGALCLIIAVPGIFYLIFFRLKKGLIAFSLAFFLAGLTPLPWSAFAYFPKIQPFIEPHWFYFSSYGFYLLFAHCWLQLKQHVRPSFWMTLTAALLLSYSLLLLNLNTRWNNQETYCRYWISLNKGDFTPYYGLWHAMKLQGKDAEAKYFYTEGIRIQTILRGK